MKRGQILVIIFLLFGFTKITAQEPANSSEKWTRIETDNKEFSMAFPPNSIIDAEDRKFGQKLRVFSFQNGVEMQLQITQSSMVPYNLKSIQPSDNTKTVSFKVGDFTILKAESQSSDRKFFRTFQIIRKDTMYFVTISAKTGMEKEISRFLFSINLQGKPLFVQKEKLNLPEETVSVSSVKTSPEVVEAFERKLEKKKINVTYEASSTNFDDEEIESLTRKAIILDRPYPVYNSNFSASVPTVEIYSAKLKVTFLANGQIGDITVLSLSNKDFTKLCIEAAQKIRFIPAQINGKPADSTQLIEYLRQKLSLPTVTR